MVVRCSSSNQASRRSPAEWTPHLISRSLDMRTSSGSMNAPTSQPRRSAPSTSAFPKCHLGLTVDQRSDVNPRSRCPRKGPIARLQVLVGRPGDLKGADARPRSGAPRPDPSGPAGECGFRFDRSGYRVPAIIVPPWVAEGDVFNQEHRHTSLIATLRDRWNLGNAFSGRDAAARTFSHAFTLDQPRHPGSWPVPDPPPGANPYRRRHRPRPGSVPVGQDLSRRTSTARHREQRQTRRVAQRSKRGHSPGADHHGYTQRPGPVLPPPGVTLSQSGTFLQNVGDASFGQPGPPTPLLSGLQHLP